MQVLGFVNKRLISPRLHVNTVSHLSKCLESDYMRQTGPLCRAGTPSRSNIFV